MRAGSRYDFPDLCSAASFMHEANASIVDNASGTLVSQLNQQAEAQGCSHRFNSFAQPESSTPPDENAGEDSPGRVGAPQTPPPATTENDGNPYGGPGETRQPTEAVHDQTDPRPVGEVSQAVQQGEGGGGAGNDPATEARRAEQGDPPEGQPRTDSHSGDRPASPSSGGEPVDLFSGAFVIEAADIQVPTPFLPIALTRRYRSGKPYFGPFGFNWDHSWNVYLRELKDGSVARWTGTLHEDLFKAEGGGWASPRGVFERLLADPGPGVGFRIEARGGLVSHFERPPTWTDAERIPLVRVEDADGNALALSYDSENRLERVTDDDGRGLWFAYGDCGFLEAVGDHSGRTVRYFHDELREHLVAVALPAVADTPEISESYEYAIPNVHPAQRHNIIHVRDALGQTVTSNTYGLDPSQQNFNHVVEQWQGGFAYYFEYEMLQGLPNDRLFRDAIAYRTTARYPDGSFWVYSFNPTGELIDDRYRLSHDKSFRVVARRMAYDEEGNPASEIEPDGAETLRIFDSANPDPRMRGNVLRIERRAATGVPLPSRIILRVDYEPGFGKVRRVRYEGGTEVVYVYDFDVAPGPASNGKLVRIDWPDATLPDGTAQVSSTAFAYNARGQQTVVTKPEGSVDWTDYFPSGSTLAGFRSQLTADVGGAGEVTSYDYDGAGFLAHITAPGGATTRFTNDARGRRTRIEQPAIGGAVDPTEWGFHPNGQVARVRRPRGDYADTAITDNFLEERIEVDPLGRVTRRILGANTARTRITRTDTDFRGRPILVTDATGVVQRSCFDERGLLLYITRAHGTPFAQTERYVHDRAGRTVQVQRPGGRNTLIDYDGWGRPHRTTYPDGTIQEVDYGPYDLPVEVRVTGDPGDGGPARQLRRTSIFYDERGRPVTTTVWRFENNPAAAVGLSETKWYDRDGRCTRRVTPTGDQWLMDYDGMGRLIRTRDPAGNVVETNYGPDGLPSRTTATDAGVGVSTVTDFAHDARGRLTSSTTQDGQVTTIRYDARDYVVETVAPDGVVGRQAFGLLGEGAGSTADATGLVLQSVIDTDLLGRPVRYVSPAGAVTTLERDPLGRLVGMTLPDGSAYGRNFDPATGDMTGLSLPGGVALGFARDPAGRMTGMRTLAAGVRAPVPDHDFRFDGLGRMVQAQAGGATVTRRYDSLDRIIVEDDGTGAITRTYDELASAITLTLPDGWREQHRLDSLGRVDRITLSAQGGSGLSAPAPGTVLAEATYRGTSRIASLDFGVSRSLSAHDGGGRLTGVRFDDAGSTAIARIIYAHDMTNRRRVTLRLGGGASGSLYGYDGRGRLTDTKGGVTVPGAMPPADLAAAQTLIGQATTAAAAQPADVWSYGADDTRQSFQPAGGAAVGYSYAFARLTAIDGAAVSSDADGSRTADPGRSFVWDAFGRLVRATSGALVTDFSYDPLGRLAAVTRGGLVERRRWFDQRCMDLRDAGGTAQTRFLHHPNLSVPYAALSQTSRWNLHYDGHLDLVLVTAQDGSPACHIRYESFGLPEVLAPGGGGPGALPPGVRPIFGAMPFEPGCGLYLTPKRPYDPLTGLFLARDPALFSFGPNAYAFAVHDPINGIDPEGDIAPLIVAGLIVGAIGAIIGAASVVIRGGDYDAWDVLAAAGIGFGAGFIGAVTFGVAAEVIGGVGLAGAAGAGLTGTAAGTGAVATGASAGVSIGTGIAAGSVSGLASGVFSGFARANYTYARHGGDYWDMVEEGVVVEGASGLVGGAVGGGMFAGSMRLGVIPPGYWASLSGQSTRLTMTEMTPQLIMRGIASPAGAGAAASGFGAGYSSGATRRLLEGESAEDAFSNAVTDGAWGAGTGVAASALNPTTWMYWRARFDPATAARIQQIRGVGAHHQRNVAQYPELATPQLSRTDLTWFERFYGRNIIGGNLTGRYSEYSNRQEHIDLHNLWRFNQSGSWTNMPGHGPWTPAWPVYIPPADPRSTSHVEK